MSELRTGWRALAAGELAEPQHLLGIHRLGGEWIVRSFHPDAIATDCVLADGTVRALSRGPVPGAFEGSIGTGAGRPSYRLRLHFADDVTHECEDPYGFPSSVGDIDLYLFAEGTHRGLWKVLGAHPMSLDGVPGVRFAVWAPRARRVPASAALPRP